jgi:hypothetical protein
MRRLPLLLAVALLAGCADDTPTSAPNHKLVTLAPADGGAADALGLNLNALSRTDLAACVAKKQTLQHDEAAFALQNGDLAARRAALQTQQAAILSDRSAVQGTNRVAVAAYNARLQAFQHLTNAYNADAEAQNERQRVYETVVVAFNTECAGHSYYQDDMDAVLKDYPDVTL